MKHKTKLESLQYSFRLLFLLYHQQWLKISFYASKFFLHTKHKVYQWLLLLSALYVSYLMFISFALNSLCTNTHAVYFCPKFFKILPAFQFSMEFCAKCHYIFLTFAGRKCLFLQFIFCNLSTNMNKEIFYSWREKNILNRRFERKTEL